MTPPASGNVQRHDAPSSFDFELGSLIGYRFVRLSTLIGNIAQKDSQAVAGLTLPEYRVLVVLHSKGPSGVIGLQQNMLIDKAWISRTLASLMDKQMVSSRADTGDARRTVYQVTVAGREAAQALIVRASERQKHILKGLTAADRRALGNYLDRIQANVEGDGS